MKTPQAKNPKVYAFLDAIREFPHVGRAAKSAGIARQTHYKRYAKDAVYREAFDQAWQWGCGVLRDEAVRRVLLGYEEPVIYKGQYQYDKKGRLVTVTKYPERLTMAVLRGELSQVYNRQHVEVSAPGGGPIQQKNEHCIRLEFVNAPPEPAPPPSPDAPADDPDDLPTSDRD